MNSLPWNCQGLGNPRSVHALYLMIKEKDPKIVFLCETLLSDVKMDHVCCKLGFNGCFCVDPVGRNGRLEMLWRKGVNFEIHNYSLRHISGWIRGVGTWGNRFITSFATGKREMSWDLIS